MGDLCLQRQLEGEAEIDMGCEAATVIAPTLHWLWCVYLGGLAVQDIEQILRAHYLPTILTIRPDYDTGQLENFRQQLRKMLSGFNDDGTPRDRWQLPILRRGSP